MRGVRVSEPSRVAALALSRDDGEELLLANLTAEPIEVVIDGPGAPAQAAIMDSRSWEPISSASDGWLAARRPMAASGLRLDAYAVASIESAA